MLYTQKIEEKKKKPTHKTMSHHPKCLKLLEPAGCQPVRELIMW